MPALIFNYKVFVIFNFFWCGNFNNIITRAAVAEGMCPEEALPNLQSLLNTYGLPDSTDYSAADIYEKTLSDKKRTGGTISLVVPTAWGKSVLHKVPVEDLLHWIEKGL